ncbi:MAG: TrpR-related protein YerC/YecD [Clostridia bacterium]|nr:TrpR-related protein YerC/YecD [Clostridia bacterium]
MGINDNSIKEFYEVILKLKTIDDCRNLFDDLCTFKELEQMVQRIEAAKLLLEGKTYEEIIALTDISSATLSRVSKCVKYGKGYKAVLDETKQN